MTEESYKVPSKVSKDHKESAGQSGLKQIFQCMRSGHTGKLEMTSLDLSRAMYDQA